VALRVLEIVAVLGHTTGFSLLPSLAARRSARGAGADGALRVAAGAVAVSILVTGPLWLAAPAVVPAVFGEQYRAAGDVARVFVLAIPVVITYYLCWFGSIAARRERFPVFAGIAGTLAAVLGVLWIAQDPTATTGAWATVLALAAMTIVLLVGAVLPARGVSRAEAGPPPAAA
jgi:O-antigen/teichoic acid export membrane protein